MPLSEYEQRMLDQMEQQLRSDDPKLASTFAERSRPSARRLTLGIALFALGLVALVSGVATQLVLVGVLGFVAMLGGVLLAMSTGGSSAEGAGPEADERLKPDKPKPSGGFMQRQEDRWQERRRDQQ